MKLHAVGWSLFFAYSGTFFKKKWLVLSCTVSYNHAKKTSSPFLRKAVLTTFLTIDRFGTRGSSGEDRFGKHGIRSGKRQKRTEKIRKMFLQFFGTRMPRVRVSPLGPSPYAIMDTMVVYGDFLLLLQYPLIWVISKLFCHSLAVRSRMRLLS